MSNLKFSVVYLPEVDLFFEEVDLSARKKIFFNINNAMNGRDPRLLKKLDSHFWEFRTEHKRIQYRLIAFWDKRDSQNTLVITTHGFIKKTDKVHPKELLRAATIRHRYLNGEYD